MECEAATASPSDQAQLQEFTRLDQVPGGEDAGEAGRASDDTAEAAGGAECSAREKHPSSLRAQLLCRTLLLRMRPARPLMPPRLGARSRSLQSPLAIVIAAEREGCFRLNPLHSGPHQ